MMVTMTLSMIIIILSLFSIVFFYLFIRSLKKRRVVRGGINLLLTISLAAVASFLLAVTMNLYTYSRLTAERSVATLNFVQKDNQVFDVTIILPDQTQQVFRLEGDEWLLEARVLKWKGWANLLGLDAQYRLERVSGRFSDIVQQNNHPPTAWSLIEQDGLDLWEVARKYPRWLPLVDASYGSAAYLPMSAEAQYEVSVSQNGLLARSSNNHASSAVSNWQ